MIAAIEQGRFYIDHRIAGQRTVLRRLFDPLLNRGNVFTGNRAALNGVDKFKSCARLLRLAAYSEFGPAAREVKRRLSERGVRP